MITGTDKIAIVAATNLPAIFCALRPFVPDSIALLFNIYYSFSFRILRFEILHAH
jgi:hypothetical protein